MFESALYVRPSHHHKTPHHHRGKQNAHSYFLTRKKSKREHTPPPYYSGRMSLWCRIIALLFSVVFNVWTVLVFTNQQFRSMTGRVTRKLESQLPPLLQVLPTIRSDVEERTALEIQQQQRYLARVALEEALERQVFRTPATSHTSVLERGFIRPWDSCTIQQARERNASPSAARPLKVVVLGGLGSALPAQDCHNESVLFKTVGYQGRYSNMLEEKLNHALSTSHFHDPNTTTIVPPTPSFEIVNMAHAALVPSLQGLVLDHLIDPQDTDLIIWENSLFDFKGNDHHEREMDFWLSRLQAHFQQAQPSRPPPPILLLHLWDELMVAKLDPSKNNAVNDTQQDGAVAWNMEPVVDNYREQKGWNIQVINVGATVMGRTESSSAADALVDPHNYYQSTCRGSQLIADMIAYTFYQDMAHCNRTAADSLVDNMKRLRGRSTTTSVDKRIRSGDYRRNTGLPLTELLVRKDIRVGSLHHWEPNIGDTSSQLKISNIEEASIFLEVAPIKSSTTDTIASNEVGTAIQNATRKAHERLSYRLPLCSCHDGYLNLTIAEPTLEWLGLAYKGGRIEAFINGGETLSLVHDGKAVTGFSLEGVRDWVHVGRLIPTPAPSYNISLCSRKVNRLGESAVWLHQLVGLMLPSFPTVDS